MIIFGILASFAALGAICWLLFNLAVSALPFFAGVSAGFEAASRCCLRLRRRSQATTRPTGSLR